MNAAPSVYLESDYQTEVVPESLTDGTLIYVASHPEIRGCRAHGSTPEEALESLSEAFRIYLEDTLADGLAMPHPKAVVKQAIWRDIPLRGEGIVAPIRRLPTVSFQPIGEQNRELTKAG